MEEILKEFIMSEWGLAVFTLLIGYGLRMGIDYIKETPTQTDDKAVRTAVKVLLMVLDEYDFGKAEEVIRKALERAEMLPDDTEKLEKELNEHLDKIKKK